MVLITSQSFIACASLQTVNRRKNHVIPSESKTSTTPNDGDSHLLVFLDSKSVVLCHGTSLDMINTVSFDVSVTVEACSPVQWSRYTTETWFPLERVAKIENTATCYRAKISQCRQGTSHSSVPYVAVLMKSHRSLPLLSLSLTLETLDDSLPTDRVESQPLLLSCLKTQLCGIFLLWKDHEIQSTVRINLMGRVFSLRTQSLLVSSRNDSSILYRILPSTKITIHTNTSCNTSSPRTMENDDEMEYKGNTTRLSPTAQYLIDTLRCLESTLNMPAASQLRFILLSGPPGSKCLYWQLLKKACTTLVLFVV